MAPDKSLLGSNFSIPVKWLLQKAQYNSKQNLQTLGIDPH